MKCSSSDLFCTLTLKKKVCLGQEPWTLVLSFLLTPSDPTLVDAPTGHYCWGLSTPHKAASLVRVLSRGFHPNYFWRVLLDPGRLTHPVKYRLHSKYLWWEQRHLLMTWTGAETYRPSRLSSNKLDSGFLTRSLPDLCHQLV